MTKPGDSRAHVPWGSGVWRPGSGLLKVQSSKFKVLSVLGDSLGGMRSALAMPLALRCGLLSAFIKKGELYFAIIPGRHPLDFGRPWRVRTGLQDGAAAELDEERADISLGND